MNQVSLNTDFLLETLKLCLAGIPVTVGLTIASILIAILPALGICVIRTRNVPVWSFLCKLYVSFIRGTPVVVQIFIVYSLIPTVLNAFSKTFNLHWNVFDTPPIIYAVVVFGLHSAATLSELFRSALMSVSQDQLDGALALGLKRSQALIFVLLPQAAILAIPNFCNLFLALLKETSLSFIMTVKDVSAIAKIQAAYTYNYIEAYIDIFFIYLILCSIFQLGFFLLEKKVLPAGNLA